MKARWEGERRTHRTPEATWCSPDLTQGVHPHLGRKRRRKEQVIPTQPCLNTDEITASGNFSSPHQFLRGPHSMVVYLHEALQHRLSQGASLTEADIEQATIDGAVQRLRPKLMTVTAVILSLAPILWESGVGSDVMKPIAAPIVGGMITSTIHVLILVPVFFVLIKRRALRRGEVKEAQ